MHDLCQKLESLSNVHGFHHVGWEILNFENKGKYYFSGNAAEPRIELFEIEIRTSYV